MSYTIFVTAPSLHPDGVAILQEAGCRLIFLDKGADEADVDSIMAGNPVDAIISRTVNLSAKAIADCPTLKVISKHGVGVSNIDVEAASARGIPVFVTPGANAQSVAEMALGLLLAGARRISWMDAELKAGRWSRAQDGLELSGKTLGLIGFGQIGQKLARACLAIGMKVQAFDPGIGMASPVEGVTMIASPAEMLPSSNVLSLHVPLNAHTRGMIDAAALAALPDKAILINTARGEVVDEAALISALESGKLYSAGLDTTAEEPISPDSPLLKLPNVVLTPHVGGSTPAALAGMATGAARNVLGFLSGNTPPVSACVNPITLESKE
ncbi:hydroxyacid dehydrogenase [Neorhizobium sp. NCHU2750]|uniref:hydroxyacid dehydrogenase n=1 Tax=Neorhizobium sp. NCHU2750 TaxID=1825976 RepID=UPI001FE109D7